MIFDKASGGGRLDGNKKSAVLKQRILVLNYKLHRQKILMHSCIAVKLRVEGCDKLIFLSCGYYFSVYLRENLHIVISLVDIRRTDKRHRNFSDTLKLSFGMETAELSAVCVAVGNDRHCLKVLCAVV